MICKPYLLCAIVFAVLCLAHQGQFSSRRFDRLGSGLDRSMTHR